MTTDEGSPVEREIDRLQRQFEELCFLDTELVIYQQAELSLTPIRRSYPPVFAKDDDRPAIVGDGFRVKLKVAKATPGSKSAKLYYTVNGQGERLREDLEIINPGWKTSFVLRSSDDATDINLLKQCLRNADRWVKNRWKQLCPIVFFDNTKWSRDLPNQPWVHLVYILAEVRSDAGIQPLFDEVSLHDPLPYLPCLPFNGWNHLEGPNQFHACSETLITDSVGALEYLRKAIVNIDPHEGDTEGRLLELSDAERDRSLAIAVKLLYREAFDVKQADVDQCLAIAKKMGYPDVKSKVDFNEDANGKGATKKKYLAFANDRLGFLRPRFLEALKTLESEKDS
ncbi:hypothetical protein CKO51_11740 [Rhodopirellula sp. SM50]|nr:hypothetical protein [Rhodopirellula sp. SM50]PAY19281.1 hypothetical protein CKO51_11740 [Rhodopirellula sp. SM50]